MTRTQSQKVWLLLVASFLASVPAAVRGAGNSHWLIAKDLLDSAGLSMVWQRTLPIKAGECIETMELLEGRLYVRSSENYMWSVSQEDGKVAFSRSIAPKGFAILGWSAYGNRLITVIDNQLVELDRDSGKQTRVSDLEISILTPPVRNSAFLFVGAADQRLHAFRPENLVSPFKVMAETEAQITSVLADEDMVVFATDEGNVIAMAPDAPKRLWQFDAPEAVAGPVVRDGQSFYFADKDTHVYRIDATGSGAVRLGWRFQTEAILDRSPRVTSSVVYQFADGKGITAIDKQSGQALWTLPEGVELLAEASRRAYVITKFNTLAIMHNGTKKKLQWINFAPVANYASNTADGRIYVADNRGRVACLKPAL